MTMERKITVQPTIETDRLLLRPVRMSDIGPIELYTADERVARACRSIPHPLPPGATEAHVTRALTADRDRDVWVIERRAPEPDEILGMLSLEHLDRDQEELAYWVAPAFWNAGIASEAVRALIEANPTGAHEIFASVFQDNPASARVLTNAGFAYIGDAEAFSLARGATVPTWTYVRKMEPPRPQAAG